MCVCGGGGGVGAWVLVWGGGGGREVLYKGMCVGVAIASR